MADYAELRAALDQTCHALLIDDPDTIRALLAERDALREALITLLDANDIWLGESRPALDLAKKTARAALAQEQGEA